MAIKMVGTKNKILDILKRREKLTASELSDYLQMTKMGVRKHLNVLVKDGWIKVENIRRSAGRPVQLFSLTSKADQLFPRNYEGMAVHFLNDIEQLFGKDSIRLLFEKSKERLLHEYEPAMADRKSNEEKISELAKLQNVRGYMSQLNQINDSTYELIEYNCPIFAIANRYRLACVLETDLIRDALKAERVERIMCRPDGEAHCRFMIKFDKTQMKEEKL
ncbi:transcriptional regulator [Sporolactobacillus sp. THM7-4]|nr:transcriptional regulator [Sporolactobacillus sp. THM7-4]